MSQSRNEILDHGPKVPPNQIGHNDVCNHTCPRTFLRDLGVDKSTDVSAKVRNNIITRSFVYVIEGTCLLPET